MKAYLQEHRASAQLPLRAFVVVAAACLLLACSQEPKTMAGGWSNTETGTSLTGRIILEDGSAAAGAGVLLRPGDYLANDSTDFDSTGYSRSQGSILDGACDSNGYFSFDSVRIGKYALEAREGGQKSALIRFEVDESGGGMQLPAATVRSAGVLTGRVRFSDSVSGSVLVRIFGLERAVVADREGWFTFEGIPEGTYTLYFTSADPFASTAERSELRVDPDSVTDAGETVLLRGLRQGFHISDGFVDLPGVDSTNPLIFENGTFINPLDGAFFWAKASMGRLDLRGTIISYGTDTGSANLSANLLNCTRLINLARISGMKSIPDPVLGSAHGLAAPASGKLSELRPVASEGASLLIREALKATPSKPLVVICGANMTTVASALLLNPSIAERLVIMGAHNGTTNAGDLAALELVSKRARLIEWGRDYVWSNAASLWQGPDVYLTNGLGQLIARHLSSDTTDSIWSHAFYGEFGPAAFLYRRKVWKIARGADFAGAPMLADFAVGSVFDFVDIPAESNDWAAIQAELLSAVNNPAAYHAWALSGGLEGESYSTCSVVKFDTTLQDASGETGYWTKAASWAEYSVQIESTGVYSVEIRHRNAAAAALTLTIPGSMSSGVPTTLDAALPQGGARWDTVTGAISLEAGLRTLRVESTQGAFFLDWIRFRKE